MSEIIKKRGRPKKEKVEVPVIPQIDTKEQARKAVEEIMSQAAVNAGIQTVNPVSIVGAPTTASSHENLSLAQEDYIPGTRVLDLQQVPKRIFDEDLKIVRQVGLYDNYSYCWVHQDKITSYRIMGYRFCNYSGGPQSGLAERGFQGTGVYEKTFEMHVRNGDMLLMWIDRRLRDEIEAADVKFRTNLDSAAEDQVHNDGYRRGIRTFKEVDGVTIYN
jgi:hypothetical protein